MKMNWDDALDSGTEILNEVIGTWRWGTTHRRVFELDGKYLAVNYDMQPGEGIEFNGPEAEVYEVERQEKVVVQVEWVRK